MSQYILRRVIVSIPVLVGVATIIFLIMHIVPGDPGALMLSGTTGVTQAQIRQLDHQLGVDRSLPQQYWSFVSGAARFDLGHSYESRADPVTRLIGQQFPATLQLTVAGMLLGSLLGIAVGTAAGIWRNSLVDYTGMVFAFAGVSMPVFWFGILLIFLFAVQLGWFPIVGGSVPHTLLDVVKPDTFRSLVLPAVTLGLALSAGVARLVRSSMVEVLGQDFIRTARAKGLRRFTVVSRHALRNALIPAVTLMGIQFGALLGGAVITETVFARQGVGRLVVAAIGQKDVPLVQGIILVFAVVQVVVNLVVDLSYVVLDPRVRYA